MTFRLSLAKTCVKNGGDFSPFVSVLFGRFLPLSAVVGIGTYLLAFWCTRGRLRVSPPKSGYTMPMSL